MCNGNNRRREEGMERLSGLLTTENFPKLMKQKSIDSGNSEKTKQNK